MSKLNFKDIVKLIHPDKNPDIKDVSKKMPIIIENKNDPYKLYELAIQWGLIKDGFEIKKISYDEILSLIDLDDPESTDKLIEISLYQEDEEKLYELAEKWGLLKKVEVRYSIEEGKEVKINGQKGIIVDVITLDNKIQVVSYINDEFKSFYRHGVKDQDKDFYVLGYAPEKRYMDVDYKYQMLKGK